MFFHYGANRLSVIIPWIWTVWVTAYVRTQERYLLQRDTNPVPGLWVNQAIYPESSVVVGDTNITDDSDGGLRPSTIPLGHGGSPQYWLSHMNGEETFVSFKLPRPGTEPRTLAWKVAVLTTTLGPPSCPSRGHKVTPWWCSWRGECHQRQQSKYTKTRKDGLTLTVLIYVCIHHKDQMIFFNLKSS